MQFNENGSADIIVDFHDVLLQDKSLEDAQFVRENDVQLYFNVEDDRIDKLIIVSACKDKRNIKLCDEIAPNLSDKGIDSYIVNLIDGSDANNTITNQQSNKYLKCIADNDPNRVCAGYNQPGVIIDAVILTLLNIVYYQRFVNHVLHHLQIILLMNQHHGLFEIFNSLLHKTKSTALLYDIRCLLSN